jgi:hypothetical protein
MPNAVRSRALGKAVRVLGVVVALIPAFYLSSVLQPTTAVAQGVSPTTPDDVRRAYDVAFEEMYRDPGNLDKTFAFAGLAVQAGDFEGAIGALERMLVIEPNLPRVRLELGVLYFRLGSYDVASTYFNDLLVDDTVPASIKEKVREFAAEVEDRTSQHRFSGSLYGGLRYQTNANAGPGDNRIRLTGLDAVLDDQFTQQGDADVFISGQASYVYDFQTEPARTFEVDLSVYANEQSDQSSVNTRFVDLRVGPRFEIPDAILEDAVFRPFVNLDYLTLGGEETFSSYGVGATFQVGLGGGWSADTLVRVLDRGYNDSDSSPDQSVFDGYRSRFSGGVQYILNPYWVFRSGISLGRDDTKTGGQTNWEYGVAGSVQHTFDAPLGLTDDGWTASFDVYASLKEYDAPNPTIDSSETRNDETIRTNLLLTIPLRNDLAMILNGAFTKVDSTLPNYEYDNFSASVGFLTRF